MAHDLFISYSTKNKAVADAVCARMETGGIRCWYAPRDIEPGADWAESIINAIDRSSILVLIFTAESNVSKQVLREVNYAVGKGVTIIPLRLTEEAPIPVMQYYLSAVHWIDALNADLDTKIGELFDTCKAYLDTKPTDVVPTQAAGNASSTGSVPEGGKKRRWVIAGIAALVLLAAFLLIFVIYQPLYKNRDESFAQSTAEQERQDTSEFSDKSEPAGNHEEGDDRENTVSSGTENTGNPVQDGKTIQICEGNPDARIGAASGNAGKEFPPALTGDSQSDLAIGGLIAYEDGWYYFRSGDSDRLYKMREDRTGVKKLSDSSAEYITVHDGYVYFMGSSCVRRVDLEGEHEYRLFGSTVTYFFIRENILYCMDYEDMYAIDLSEISDDYDLDTPKEEFYIGSFPEGAWPSTCCADDEYIYYKALDDYYLYRAKFDASEIELLLDHMVYDLVCADGCLYFTEMLSWEDDKHLAAFDLASGAYTSYPDVKLHSEYNVTGDGLYCSDADRNLVLFDPSTGTETVIYDEHDITDICVCHGRIYYNDWRDYCMIDRNGKNKMTL